MSYTDVSLHLRIVAVSRGHPDPTQLLETAMFEANDYDVVFVESISRGYSRIKLLEPDLVIVFLEMDDVAACQLLSMLKMDHDTSGIPVVTWPTGPLNERPAVDK